MNADTPKPDAVTLLAETLARIAKTLPGVEPEGLGPKSAAEYIGVSVSQLHDMNARGLMPEPAQVGDGGRCGRWSRTELKAWLLAGAPPRGRWVHMREGALRRVG